ncbi:hypothetical protein LP085_08060 [Achromobacter sp. MY14]|uniref:hypothetical protein n=1 Tax=unclassified Achromobacter TaxID=2626865 RepID=UPI001E2F93EB|nr:hypothetical protein [Achromobacter sp. MY14]MCD0496800.1 hypothetical protein [Achromobacter sp. MY14]
MQNNKRNDVQDILAIIKDMDERGEWITAPTISKYLGQSAANVSRILKAFGVSLRPYQAKYKAKVKEQDISTIAARLRRFKTENYTLEQLAEKTGYDGGTRKLKAILVKEKLPYKTKSWFAQHLKKVETESKTMRELFNECKAKDKSINYTTFRTRLYENAIPYKTVWSRKIWWQDLKGLDKNVPQDAIDELHAYFKENQVNTLDYTAKELYGYFDFNMPYLAFKHLIVSQGIETAKPQ